MAEAGLMISVMALTAITVELEIANIDLMLVMVVVVPTIVEVGFLLIMGCLHLGQYLLLQSGTGLQIPRIFGDRQSSICWKPK